MLKLCIVIQNFLSHHAETKATINWKFLDFFQNFCSINDYTFYKYNLVLFSISLFFKEKNIFLFDKKNIQTLI